MTTVPFSISAPLTVTMRALRIANTPRGGITPYCVVGFPGCWAITGTLTTDRRIVSRIFMAAPPRCVHRLHELVDGVDPASAVTALVREACLVRPVLTSCVLSQDLAGAPDPVGDRKRSCRRRRSYRRAHKR